MIHKTVDGYIFVYEQDYPGRLQASSFNLEYVLVKEDVYIGRLNSPINKQAYFNILNELRDMAGEDKLFNYSFKSYLGFVWEAVKFKITGKEPKRFLTGEPKRGTVCSQIIAKLFQRELNVFKEDDWWEFYPVDIAMSNDIEIYKLKI